MHIVSRVGIGKIPPSSPLYLDVGGAVNFDSTLYVIGQTTVNSLISSQLPANTSIYESRISGDTNALFAIKRDGLIEWGLGGGNVPDVNLYRSDISTLKTNGSLVIDNSLVVGNQTSDTATFTARIASNFDPSITNLYSLGQDSLRWQNLWLSVKLTSVDGLFSGDLQVNGNIILGDATSDSLTLNARVASSVIPSTDNFYDFGSSGLRWKSLWLGTNLQVDGNTVLGDTSADILAVNARVSTPVIPSTNNSFDLGSSLFKWASLWLGTNLQVDGNTVLGDTSADILAVNARISTSVVPSSDNLNNLGSLSQRWASLWLGTNLQVDGNTILGDSPSDTVTINAGFASPINPSVDNFYDLGTLSYRWKQLHTGPSGVVVRNDTTDTNKVSLFFNSGVAVLNTSSAIPLQVTTGSNNGIKIDTSGRIGINTSASLSENFNVNGTSVFSDVAYFSKSSGTGLQVESVASIKGSVESGNTANELNIGIDSATQFVNIGTGSLTKTINIGTGTGKTTINIGGSSDIININGTVTTTQTIQSFVTDKTLSLNVGGLNGTAQNSGILVEEASSSFLTISNPTWQNGNTVRYSAVNTGNIEIGSVILISGFSFSQNNGQFTVTGILTNSYFEIQNTAVNSAAFNETNFGTTTNPTISGKILISSDRLGWEIYSPSNSLNYFKISNTGANVELKATSSGISVVATGLLPETSNTALGSSSKLWNAFLNNLTTYGDAVIGDASSDILTINATSSFVGNVNSNIIPNSGKNLGSLANPWAYLYAQNAIFSSSLEANGTINLGVDSTTTINANGKFSTSLVPSSNNYNLGSETYPWNTAYITSISFPTFQAGSVLFIDSTFKAAQNNSNFFWENNYKRLNLGQNDGPYVLDIKKYQSDSFRIRNSQNNSAIALRTKETLFNVTTSIQNGPEPAEVTSVSFNSTNRRIGQTFILSSTTNFQKISLQLSTVAPTLVPNLSGTMTVALYQVIGGVVQSTPIATSAPLNLLGFPIGFQTSFTDFNFYELQTLAAGTYLLAAEVVPIAGLLPPSSPSYLDNCVKIVSKADTSYGGGRAYFYDALSGWQLISPAADLCFKIYDYVDLNTPVVNKFEFTDILQFGANTYSNVGNGTSTAVLELSSTAVKLLGAVSVNSTSISSATYTVQPTDVILNVNTTVSGCTITLPLAATKRILVIKDIGNNASTTGRSIQLAPASNEYVEFNTINVPFVIERDGESVTLQSDGTSRWYII